MDTASHPQEDERQSQLKLLIAKGKEQGYLTYGEVNDHLPSDIVAPEQIEDIVLAEALARVEEEVVVGVAHVEQRRLERVDEARGEEARRLGEDRARVRVLAGP